MKYRLEKFEKFLIDFGFTIGKNYNTIIEYKINEYYVFIRDSNTLGDYYVEFGEMVFDLSRATNGKTRLYLSYCNLMKDYIPFDMIDKIKEELPDYNRKYKIKKLL